MIPFSPTKKLGQNFLVDERVLERIMNSCDCHQDDIFLEIGPGQGVLTRAIMPRVKRVIAVEADPRLMDELQRNLVPRGLVLHQADILTFDLSRFAKSPLKVIGNIPYNLSSPILEKMIRDRRSLKSLFFTVQYEFGKRLTAATGTRDRSALTCLLEFFAVPKILFRISNQAFRPVPKVESCFVRIDFKQMDACALKDESLFIKVVKTAFCQRRKTLLNALAGFAARETLQGILAKAGVQEKARPEDVLSEDYARISNILFMGG